MSGLPAVRGFVLGCTLALLVAPGAPLQANGRADGPERLWRHRNLGSAYFANGDFAEASLELAAAVTLAPESFADLLNLGIASLLANDLAPARRTLERAWAMDSTSVSTAYARGILEKRDGNLDAARSHLLRCRALGGKAPELHYNLGILAVRAQELEKALAEFGAITELGSDHAPRHYASALYRLGRTQLQLGKREEGRESLSRYQTLVKEGRGAELNEEELEAGDLLQLVAFERPRETRSGGALPAFALEALPGTLEIRWAEVADLDGDGDQDLLAGNGQTIRDLRAEAKGFVEVTASRGLAGLLGVAQARALDLDNDGALDLVRAGEGGIHFHPGIAAGWDPPLQISGAPTARFAPVDFDHEGDIDLVSVGAVGVRLLRNNGDRTFTDVTEASGLAGVPASSAVTTGDLDDDQDVDLAFVTRRGDVFLASNERGGRFTTSSPSGSPASVFDLVAGDLDGDGDLDLGLSLPRGVVLAENAGDLSFRFSRPPAIAFSADGSSLDGGAALFAGDLDNDGLIDLLASLEKGGVIALNDGDFRFLELPEPLRPLGSADARPVALALVDGDAKLDLITSRAEVGIARNIAAIGNAIVLAPRGVENCRDGVGAIFELLAGTRYGRRDSSGGLIHFGLGEHSKADAVRVRWPNGVRQAILDPVAGAVTKIEEKAGLVGSCPLLYTWNSERFEFLTDILTVTPLGLPSMPGTYVPPDWDEAIRVTSLEMQPDDAGDLVAQVTEELREVTYLDQARLYAIDHPSGTEVQPNEKFKFPPFPEFGVHVLEDARPPVRATDHRGLDVTELLASVDDLVVGDLPLTRYQGITSGQSLVLDFGQVPPDAPLTLHLAGWFYWTNASINLAIWQNPRFEFSPPSLEALRMDGSWERLPIEVGFPGGKTKSIPVDLSGAFPDGRAVLRLSTTLRIYWDRALLQVGAPAIEPRVSVHLPDQATLRYRGHSEPIVSRSGEEPERFDYEILRQGEPPWDQHPGRYTRYGDVTPLVQSSDDMFVIMASGDECTLRWRAAKLPALAGGFERTYFLVFDGWAKDGDPNTFESGRVEPLPFHGMSGYPYGAAEAYPSDEAHREYQATWNTREGVRLTRDLPAEAKRAAALAGELP